MEVSCWPATDRTPTWRWSCMGPGSNGRRAARAERESAHFGCNMSAYIKWQQHLYPSVFREPSFRPLPIEKADDLHGIRACFEREAGETREALTENNARILRTGEF